MNLMPDDTNIEKAKKQVLEASLKGVEEFLNSYKDKAIEYVYESELQASLYSEIKSCLENCKWNCGKKEWVVFYKKRLKTDTPCLVHCEQGYKNNGRNNRIDIAVWDPTEKNAEKTYSDKDLLLLVEIKYRVKPKNVIKAVTKDYKKLKDLKLKEYQKGLVLTFTISDTKFIEAELEKSKKSFRLTDDVYEILNEKQFRENSIQALVACRDGIIEVPF